MRSAKSRAIAFAIALSALVAPAARAQRTGAVQGAVVSAADGHPLANVTVRAVGTNAGAVTGPAGEFLVRGLPPGGYRLEASFVGYRPGSRRVTVAAGDTVRADFTLAVQPIEVAGIDVRVLRPDLRPQSKIEAEQVREASPQDPGELLRVMPGAAAVRRGPLGLDPVVRGLRETQVGVYVDGTRMFPAGPARMDSPLTHIDPGAIGSIEVVKGPYALTWGAGNLSSIRVETADVPRETAPPISGRVSTGYESNLDAGETTLHVGGRQGRVGWWAQGAWRGGDDYEDGHGDVVPGDFRSSDARAKLGVDLGSGSRLSLTGGYQDQGPIDYPGRLLTARFFHATNFAVRWNDERQGGRLRSVEALAYVNDVDHQMDNREKPTAFPDPDRMPPFALDIRVVSQATTWGGRLATGLDAGDWRLDAGGDLTVADRLATRFIRRRDSGMLLFEDLAWPDARITDAGAYLRGSRSGERTRLSATVRLDGVHASADSTSAFFRENVSTERTSSEANLSAAATVGFDLDPHWTLSLGLGSAVRTADVLERYSDRFPATRAQTSAEFVGDPSIAPERNTQGDVWLEGIWPGVALQLNAFARRLDDYITLEPTDLPKRLPLSPPTVYRYVNGLAKFWGYEASAAVVLDEAWTVKGTTDYLWGQDETLDEPALGVEPMQAGLSLRRELPGGPWFVEVSARATAEQTRVSTTRNEGRTAGYTAYGLRAGLRMGSIRLRGGVDNLTDRQIVDHLNARNPFTGEPVPEPGRVVFAGASYSF